MSCPRQLVLVDIENLLGTPDVQAPQVHRARAALAADLPLGPNDLVVVASSHHVCQVVGFEWRGVRHVVRSGPDGADLALLEVLETENVAQRFSRVVIASGDGIFSDAAAALGAAGVHVTAAAGQGGLSRRLRMAAATTVFLTSFTHATALKDIA